MAFKLNNRTVSKVGAIGTGQIGPDIALFFENGPRAKAEFVHW